MTSILGPGAKKWMKMIISFIGDPSKYGLPKQFFQLPPTDGDEVNSYLEYAEQKWRQIDPKEHNPYENIEENTPFWMIFTLSRRASMLMFAVWDEVLEERNREVYQDLHYNFQELIQNFIREHLGLFKIVRPFREKTGNSVLGETNGHETDIPEEVLEQLNQFTSPQKILHNIAYFVKGKTIHAGIAYILLIERFSSLITQTRNNNQLEKVTTKFVQEVERLNERIIARSGSLKAQVEPYQIDEAEKEVIEFEKIILQEYDGYVEIKGISQEEKRNFRIYNCLEEDMLREEMWKERRYPIRRLVDSILEERYSKPTKEYKLKYGVEIDLLDPNWIN